MSREDRRVIFASSLGTVFEWYDFYLYGALAGVIASQFFSGLDPRTGFVFALLAFAAGFLVRPFGALLFGRLGDLIGRKYTFLVTILVMGLASFVVGLLPTYGTVGVAAPVMLVALRLMQGLALGGEYGGAAIYVAENAPQAQRGAHSAWIQTTATLGFCLSLVVVLGVRTALGEEAFAEWGWRVPFLLSAVLLALSVWVRLSLQESPAFRRMKAEGRASRQPVKDALGRWRNLRVVLLALFGITAGQAVVWYTSQIYALFFLTQSLRVDAVTANLMVAAALLLGTPFFILFGALSDRIGRKPVIMAGLLLAALTYLPVFSALTRAAHPALAQAQATAPVVLQADPGECSLQASPVTREPDLRSSCDVARRHLAQNAISHERRGAEPGTAAIVHVGSDTMAAPATTAVNGRLTEASRRELAAFRIAVDDALRRAGYPAAADPQRIDRPRVIALLTYLVVLVAMVYGPLAALLVELFPTRVRYTSVSLPYHVGNGWFGGLLPATAFAIGAQTGDMYNGLWYPIAIAALTCVVGTLLIPETRDVDIYAGD